jgi:predicted methyltransferase
MKITPVTRQPLVVTALSAAFALSMLLTLSVATRAQVPPATAGEVAEEPALPQAQIPGYIKNAVQARSANDKKLDTARKPEQVMAFMGVKPGMQVADIFAGGGWMTEILSRTVGPDGKVYSINPPFPLRFHMISAAWQKRLKKPELKNVVAVSKPLDSADLIPAPAGSLDAAVIELNYHDLVGMKRNRAALNATIFKALKPGGVYCVIDHSAKAGTGAQDASTLHRIDQQFVIDEVEKAGFKLAGASSALRNAQDQRTTLSRTYSGPGHTDRFMLKFVKPS